MKICARKDTRSPKMCWGFLKAGHGTNRDVSDLIRSRNFISCQTTPQAGYYQKSRSRRQIFAYRKEASIPEHLTSPGIRAPIQ